MLKKFKILFVLFLLLNGCGLFGLRDTETPTESRTHFDPPISPYVVISNLIYSVTEKDVNNYLNCFVDTAYTTNKFYFSADIASQIQYPVFINWTLSNEKSYFNNLLALTNQNYSFLLLNNENWINYSDSAIYDADYLLRFDHQKPNVSKALNGKLRFVMVLNTKNLWSISRWIDFKASDADTTWSVLKANFSN